MSDLSKELTKRMEEARKDTTWVEKIRAAATWEEYGKLLDEKGIEAPAELKEAFAAAHAGKTGKLEDDDLEKVSGGLGPLLPCWKEYNYFLCNLSHCPNFTTFQDKCFCDIYNWCADL